MFEQVSVWESLDLELDEAVSILKCGGIVAFGTETVYGLGGNALNPGAVAKIFAAKQRPSFDPLIVHLSDRDEINNYTTDLPDAGLRLISEFWPGPLTIVVPKREVIPDLVTSGLPRVALRVPDHEQARELIRCCGFPLAAPSANRFGGISPTTAEHVLEGLGDAIDGVLDFGPCRVGVESTVVTFDEDGQTVLLRPGGLTIEELESVVGSVRRLHKTEIQDDHPQASPGMLSRHYAPSKKMTLVKDFANLPDCSDLGALSFRPFPRQTEFAALEVLSESGDLIEATAMFFSALRRLERGDCREIVATPFPQMGLGRALNDRLQRAACNDIEDSEEMP